MSYYAIDFGTSNSLLNFIDKNGKITPVPLSGENKYILRSLLYTHKKGSWFFGDSAIDEYIETDGEGRFFKSLKKFLPEANYNGTEVHNLKLSCSDLISVFLREMRLRANDFTKTTTEKVIMGRPALYSNDLSEDKLAESRMLKASELAGFKETIFCPEPLAAGLDFDKDNQAEKIVLIADFGGGTSDFTLMKLHSGQYSQDDILGLSGIFKAGDAFDGQMMLKLISHHFGSRFEYKLPMGNNVLKFPRNLLKKICSPAHITHLREKDTWSFLQELEKYSIDDEKMQKLEQLFALVEYQQGFPLFNELEKFKVKMSSTTDIEHEFLYKSYGIDIKEIIERENYNEKMLDTVDDIINSMMEVFHQSGLKVSDVNEVCLTGGTGQFNLIQERLFQIFGEEKISKHNIYQSVVGGLSEFAKQKL